MSLSEALLFLRSWRRAPGRVGALAPSGRSLAALIAASIDPADGPVIELGPGTGALTQALLARGVPRERLALVESDRVFAHMLRRRFPGVRVLHMDAELLGRGRALFGKQRARHVVSGLPLLSMPAGKALAIVRAAFERQLHADGVFLQFTYIPRCPISNARLAAIGLRAVRTGVAVANLPPAFVYRFERIRLH